MRAMARGAARASGRVLAVAALLAVLGGPATTRSAEEPSAEPVGAGRVEVGQAAPDFELASTDGTVHRLSDLRGKKSLVLVFFRGTW